MWGLYLKCKTLSQLPSEVMRVPPLRNDWAAYQFDNAVLFAGLTIENALAEREKIGDAKNYEYRAKYTLSQLLDPTLLLPAPAVESHGEQNGLAALLALAGKRGSGVKEFRYVAPEPGVAQ